MPCLYSFWYEFRMEHYKVSFYDSTTNIIAAESLGQIDSQSRRKWAQTLFEIFEKDENIIQLECHYDESDGNLFSKRLATENWTPYVAVFGIENAQHTLHIYRFYLYYFTRIFKFLRNVNLLRL